MNFDEAMTWDKYTHQKLKSEFADALTIASRGVLNIEKVKAYMKILAEKMGEFISKQGYKSSDKSDIIIKVPGSKSTADPTNPFATVGGKVECDLTATKDQYVFYASEIIGELKEECKRQIEHTWGERLLVDLQSKFDERYPYYDRGDPDERDTIDRFMVKRKELMEQIDQLVDKFQKETL